MTSRKKGVRLIVSQEHKALGIMLDRGRREVKKCTILHDVIYKWFPEQNLSLHTSSNFKFSKKLQLIFLFSIYLQFLPIFFVNIFNPMKNNIYILNDTQINSLM